MRKIVQEIKRLVNNPDLFIEKASGIRLRGYQKAAAEAIIRSVTKKMGLSIVVMFPRQSGKNELQAQIECYLLTLFSELHSEMVKVSPTWKPQSLNAMRRLERVLEKNVIVRTLWEKETGYIYRINRARIFFLSGAPEANIVAQAFRGIAAYGLVLAAIGYGQHYLNRPGKLLGIARDLSFPLYILHYLPLTAATYLLLNSGLPIWTRWILAVAASWGSVALFTFLARFVPLVRSFFSIRQPAVKTS